MKIKPIHILKKEAKALRKQTSCSQVSALNAIAVKSGFDSWSMLLHAHSKLKPSKLHELDEYINFNDNVILIAGKQQSFEDLIITLSLTFIKEQLKCNLIRNSSNELIMEKLLLKGESKNPITSDELNPILNKATEIADSELYISEVNSFINIINDELQKTETSKPFRESRLILDSYSYSKTKDLIKKIHSEKEVSFKTYLIVENDYKFDSKNFNKIINVSSENSLEFLKPV